MAQCEGGKTHSRLIGGQILSALGRNRARVEWDSDAPLEQWAAPWRRREDAWVLVCSALEQDVEIIRGELCV